MAAKKKAVKKKAANSAGKALMTMDDWEKELAGYAEADSARVEGGMGAYLSVRGKKFSMGGNAIGEELDIIVANFVHESGWYEDDYDAENPTPPDCFALSLDGKDMAPHPNSLNPQSEVCATCWANEWGSGKGKGKACKNQRRLALLDAEADNLEEAEMALLRIAPTGVKPWDNYVNGLSKKLNRPCWSVVTRLSFDEEVDYPKVSSAIVEPISDPAMLSAVKIRTEEAASVLMEPYDTSNMEPKKATKGGKKKAVKKKAAKKKGKTGSKFRG
jgi:hypothetical protein